MKTGKSAQGVDSGAISALKEFLATFQRDLGELKNENEQTQSALNKINNVLESHVLTHNDVYLTQTESIHRIFVSLDYI